MAKAPSTGGRPPKPKPPTLQRDANGLGVKYGRFWPKEFTELEIELSCFRLGFTRETGGLGKYGHLKKALKMVWPKLDQHEWMDWKFKNLCQWSTNVWTGCATSAKTYDAGLYAMAWWLADPLRSSVILTSTTGKMIKKRIWPVIQELYDSAERIPYTILGSGFPGNMVDSKTTLQAKKGDDKHGIFAIAVRDGPVNKAVADIQGIHSPRMLLVVDEATDTPEAIFKVFPNIRKACEEITIIVINNPESHVDPAGRISEPLGGWPSVNVEDEEWETKGVPEWEIDPGICLHFDGLKSPNIKAGVTKHLYLFGQKDLDSARRAAGFEVSIGWWKYTRGFYAPAGVCNTVFSEPLIDKHDGQGKHTWISKTIMLAGFDPAFGGDRPILRFALMGDLESGLMGIQLLPDVIEIPLLVAKGNEIHYQLADRVKAECEKRGVKPEHFAMDVSGGGSGTADIISRQWSPNIVRVQFGGAPSEMQVSNEDNRPATDAFDRKVTELYFSALNFLFGSQLKGFLPQDITELCTREYQEKLRKKQLDTKAECKKKIGKSPDYADALVIITHLARHLGAIAGGEGTPVSDKTWEEFARKSHEIYAEEAFATPTVDVSFVDSGWN